MERHRPGAMSVGDDRDGVHSSRPLPLSGAKETCGRRQDRALQFCRADLSRSHGAANGESWQNVGSSDGAPGPIDPGFSWLAERFSLVSCSTEHAGPTLLSCYTSLRWQPVASQGSFDLSARFFPMPGSTYRQPDLFLAQQRCPSVVQAISLPMLPYTDRRPRPRWGESCLCRIAPWHTADSRFCRRPAGTCCDDR
jgi:hypothetical protein